MKPAEKLKRQIEKLEKEAQKNEDHHNLLKKLRERLRKIEEGNENNIKQKK